MSAFPGSPRLLKGAIVGIDSFNPLASIIVFQYNPDTLNRTLTAQTVGGDNTDRAEVMRFKGPPQESMRLDVEIDATDQLEEAKAPATKMGIYPALAALELLLYPKSAIPITNEALLAAGMLEIIPPEAPLTLFIWGVQRILPVRLTEFSITEEAFDPNLNPIRAKVSLSMRVLSYHDLGISSLGGSLFMVHQLAKEAVAQLGRISGTPTQYSLGNRS